MGSIARKQRKQTQSDRLVYMLWILLSLILVQANTPNPLNNPVPHYIIQYGHKRTGTTLQFNTLCVIMAVIHADKPSEVSCEFVKRRNFQNGRYHVVKAQEEKDLSTLMKQVPAGEKVWLFATSGEGKARVERGALATRWKVEVPYVADFRSLALRSVASVTSDYKRMFGLDNVKMDRILEYIQYWDILRLCCGGQMSVAWRQELIRRADEQKAPAGKKHGRSHLALDYSHKRPLETCGEIDID
eukprot:1626534-Pyramimonas_sp.AAC.1